MKHLWKSSPNTRNLENSGYESRLDTETERNSWSNGLLGKLKRIFLKYVKFIGPGLMISVAYMDPGNYATGVSAGATNEFSLLCIVLYASLIAVFLQTLCIRLGTVTGFDISRACREFFPMWLNLLIYVMSEIAVIATDVAEVIGGAIALNILLKVPLPAGICITCVDILLVLMAYGRANSSMKFVRIFEMFVASLVLAVTICLCIELAYIPSDTSVSKVFRGFVPSKQMFENNGVYTATSLLGATVMPHSLFLGSGIVQPRLLEFDLKHGNYTPTKHNDDDPISNKESDVDKEEYYVNYRPSIHAVRYAMKYSIAELALTLITFALFVNCAILIVAGSALYGTERAVDADLYTIHDLLAETLAPVAGTIFMLALLFSGQSAGIVCTIAGQIVCEGHIKWTVAPWKRRLITRAISIIPCLAISLSVGKEGLSTALNASQVVLSILLPFVTAPLIYFTSKKSIMRIEDTTPKTEGSEEQPVKTFIDMSNGWITMGVAILVWIFVVFLNIYTIVELAINHGQV